MTKLYVTEFPGFASVDIDGSVDVAPEPATATQVIDTAAAAGPIGTLGAITAGTLYTNGTYNGVALTGGTGSGATANITVSGGGVTAVQLVSRGTGYKTTDSLSASAASIGGTGSGFAIAISTITQQITLAASTRVIELAADGICSFVVGFAGNAGSDPVATTSNARIPANNQPFRRRVPGPIGTAQNPTSVMVSAITNT